MVYLIVGGVCCLLAILGGVILAIKDTPKSKEQIVTRGLNDKQNKS